MHKLFLVTEYFYCDGGQGSAIVVYNERGDMVETITGFKFAIGEPAPAINPAKRMGWAFGGSGRFQASCNSSSISRLRLAAHGTCALGALFRVLACARFCSQKREG